MDGDLRDLPGGFEGVLLSDPARIYPIELPDDFEDVFHGDHSLQRFPLFSLPAEIWLRIAEFAVLETKTINVTRATRMLDQEALVRQPALTRTCRLLRTEALPMFYRNNSFEARHFCEHACPRQWLVAIGIENLRRMRTFRMHTRMSDDFWKGCFKRTGIETEVEVTDDSVKGRCPHHASRRHGRFQTLAITFL
ncbi:hypothetical protein LTS10_001973 [Elasticomyces elasticus]|nr:hypothetical protein LTS10_001973 [Elasticomyces elasticus]